MSKRSLEESTIWQVSHKQTTDFKEEEVYDKLAEVNEPNFNILKTIEELNELATVLTQSLTKPNRVNKKDITDEIGDVKIRLEVLERMFSKKSIKRRIRYKLSKYCRLIKSGKLKGRI